MPAPQGRYWMLTIKETDFDSFSPMHSIFQYIKGQLEIGAGGFRHWQIFAITKRTTMSGIKAYYPSGHIELTRSAAAEDYVFKDDTAVENTRFEKGLKPLNRNSAKDWALIKKNAVEGKFD